MSTNTINVTLPNGTVINNVPEGISRAELKRLAINNGLATPGDFGDAPEPVTASKEPEKPKSWLDNIRQDIRAARQALRNRDPVGSTLGGVIHTASSGLVDHAAAGVKTAIGDQGYAQNLKEIRDVNAQQPATRLVGQVAGALVPAAGIANWLGRGSTAVQVGKAAGTGATTGAVYGAATGELEDIADNAQEGALIGGVFGAAGQGIVKALNARKVALDQRKQVNDLPTVEQLKEGARTLYKAADDAGVSIKPKPLLDGLQELKGKMSRDGYSPSSPLASAQAFYRVFDDVIEAVGTKRMSWQELEQVRRRLNAERMGTSDPDTKRLMGQFIDHFDNIISEAPSSAFMMPAGSQGPKAVIETTKAARTAWKQAAKADVLQEFVDKVLVRAEGRDTSSLHRVMLSNFAQFRQSKQWKLFNKEEQEFLIKTFREGKFDKLLNLLERTNQGQIGLIGSAAGAVATSGATLPLNIAGKLGSELRDRQLGSVFDGMSRQIANRAFELPNRVSAPSGIGAVGGGLFAGAQAPQID